MLNTEDEDCVPVWPDKDFARQWATEEWGECRPEMISVDTWFTRWTSGLQDDELSVVVFPNLNQEGVILYPEEFDHELRTKIKSLSGKSPQ